MYNGYTGRLSDGKRNNAHCSRDLRLDNQSIHLLWIVQLYPSVMCAQESGWWLSSRDWYNLKMAPTLYAYGAHMIVVWHFLRLLKFEKWKIIKKKRKSQNQQDANLTFSTLHTARWDISIEQLLDKKKLIFKSKYKSTDEKEKINFYYIQILVKLTHRCFCMFVVCV